MFLWLLYCDLNIGIKTHFHVESSYSWVEVGICSSFGCNSDNIYLVCVLPGIAVKTTMDAAQTVQYTALISGITKQVISPIAESLAP